MPFPPPCVIWISKRGMRRESDLSFKVLLEALGRDRKLTMGVPDYMALTTQRHPGGDCRISWMLFRV